MTDPTTFRDSIGRLGPPWTQDKWGSRFKYTFGVILDAITDALRDGARAGFPGAGTPEGLPYSGADRKIVRGFDESDESYAARQSRAFIDWKHAGAAHAIEGQLEAYVTPATPRIRIVWSTVVSSVLITTWVTLNPDGTVEFLQVDPGNWDWDGNHAPEWSRFWVIIYPVVISQSSQTWDDGSLWDDGHLWDISGVTADQLNTLRRIVQTWKRAASQCGASVFGGGLIAAFSSGIFDPTSAPGAPMPDGTWGNPSNRDTGAAYIDGF